MVYCCPVNLPMVFVVVLNWNSPEETTRCTRSLEALEYPNVRILIVDNGSTDGSATILQRTFPRYTVLQTGSNLGYAAGNNRGIQFALDHGADYVWILNPDATTEPDALSQMVQAMERDPQIGICGPRLLWGIPPTAAWIDGATALPHTGYRVVHQQVAGTPTEATAEIVNTGFVIGCSMLIRKELFFTIGLLREDFFLYYEEVEYALRARDQGWRAVVCRSAKNRHHYDDRKKPWKSTYYLCCRNVLLLARIRRAGVRQTVWAVLDLPARWGELAHGRLRTATIHLGIALAALGAGLRKPIACQAPRED